MSGTRPAPRSVVIHAEEAWFAPIRDGKFEFFTKLESRCAREGLATHLVDAASRASRLLLAEDSLHLMVGNAAAYGPRILHAKPAYVWGFWYLDEVGANWNSSIRFARFNADEIDAGNAEYFFNGVSGHMLRENVSLLPQEIETERDRSHYLTTEQMIRTAADHRRDELVYVKLHPLQSKQMRRDILAVCNDYQNVRISEASIHDLAEVSSLVVTQNSAAGFEALMQRKPVITCAKSDFWHATLTAKTPADLRDALSYGAEAMAGFPYEKFFYWFLDRQCLEPAKENFAARAWARIREKVLF
jgi:hypothetical protein